MPGLVELFDTYSLRARIYPAFLTVLPATVVVVMLWPQSPIQTVWPLVASLGVTFFLANWVRDRGTRLEKVLTREWDGLPTTRLLRWRNDAGDPDFGRRRARLEQLVGFMLPDLAAEVDVERSDAIYVSAVRMLRAWVRQQPEASRLVQEENASYGFRRNLLALKPIGVGLSLIGIAFDVGWAICVDAQISVIVAIVHVLVLVGWLTVVQSDWVREQGERYASQLFDVLLGASVTPTRSTEP